MEKRPECAQVSCEASAIKKGYCERHYRQARRNGEFGGTVCSVRGCRRISEAHGLCHVHYQHRRRAEAADCAVEGCTEPQRAVGYCGRHYTRYWKHGDPLAWKKPKKKLCSIEDCDHKAVAFGLCDTHYRRQKRYGTTDRPPKPVFVDHAPYRCKQCGAELPKLKLGRRSYCSKECAERWQYWDRRRNSRAGWLKKYGLTPETFDAMLQAQGGLCAICETDKVPKRGSWSVDHDHSLGKTKVRGLLCTACNSGLGHFHDNPALLRKAAAYLER